MNRLVDAKKNAYRESSRMPDILTSLFIMSGKSNLFWIDKKRNMTIFVL